MRGSKHVFVMIGVASLSCTSKGDTTTSERVAETREALVEAGGGGGGHPHDGGGITDAGGPNVLTLPYDVLTHHNDAQRTGVQSGETYLTTANVSSLTWGASAYLPNPGLDGGTDNISRIYTQPLYVSCVTHVPWDTAHPNACHDVVYVTTSSGCVWEVDASINTNTHQFGNTTSYRVQTNPRCFPNRVDDHDGGILGTPVIDKTNSVLYVVHKSTNGGTSFTLYVLNLNDLSIKASLTVAAYSEAGTVTNTFVASAAQLQRPALLLNPTGTRLYVAFGATTITPPGEAATNQHGWLMAYDVSNPSSPALANTNPYVTSRVADSTPGQFGNVGIWQAGAGPAMDLAGTGVFIATANGFANSSNDANQIVKLSSNGVKAAAFQTANSDFQTCTDTDFGVGGPVVVGSYVLAAGKNGVFSSATTSGMADGGTVRATSYPSPYVYVDPSNCTTVQCDSNGAPVSTGGTQYCCPSGCVGGSPTMCSNQAVGPCNGAAANYVSGLWQNPVAWNGSLYYWGDADFLNAVTFNSTTGAFGSPTRVGGLGTPGGPNAPTALPINPSNNHTYEGQAALSLSVNGNADPSSGSAILWAYVAEAGDPTNLPTGWLMAFNPLSSNANPLWRWTAAGIKPRFSYPTIANSRVFIVTDYNNGTPPALVAYCIPSCAGGVCVC